MRAYNSHTKLNQRHWAFVKGVYYKLKSKRDNGRNGLFDFPFPASLSDCNIEISGSKAVLIDGCRGVAFCSAEHIRISVGSRYVAINGSDLVIASMFGSTVSVEGSISSVEFI